MSYVLHVWDDPAVQNVQAALALIPKLSTQKVSQNPKFIAFADALTKVYPDLSNIDGDDDDTQPCVWTDSPMDGRTDAPLLTIGVATQHLTDRLMQLIAHAAADRELHLFDMQAGRLYRPDRKVTDGQGNIVTLGGIPPDLGTPVPARTLPPPNDTIRYLHKRFISAFPDAGWAAHENNGSSSIWYVGRAIGQVTQKIRFNVHAKSSESSLSVNFGFTVPEIYDTIAKLAPKEYRWRIGVLEREDKSERVGLDYRDLHIPLTDLFPFDQTASLGIENRFGTSVSVCSMDELAHWADTLVAWFEHHVHRKLDAARDVNGLSRLFDTEWFRDMTLAHGGPTGQWLTHLLIEHLANSPQIQDWADNIRVRTAMDMRHQMKDFIREHYEELLEVTNLLAPSAVS